MTGFQTRALLLLAFEIVSQRILALYGLKNESWIIFRCGLKLLSYPVSIKIIHPDFFWVYVNIHLLQIGPNFVDASIYPHVLSLANILYCCYGTYYHLNKSFHHSLSIFFGFFFQHVLVTYFKTLYSANAMNLERKLGEFESIVLSIQSHIIKTDLDLQILLINKDILGHKGDDLRGCSFKNLSIFQKETFDSVIKTKSTESYKIQAFVDQQNLYNSLPLSHFKTVILMTKEEKIAQQMKTLLYGMNVQNMCFPKSKREIYDTYQYFSDCKIFVDDDLLEYLPSKIPPDQVVVIGNSSKKNNEYNDCLRLFKPLLPSHLIIELTPTLKKKFSGEIKLLDGATVLIVEDHVVIQKCIKKIIEKMGPKRVIVASDGEEALKSFHLENNIDIIISDLNMPKMDGFKLIQSIKSEDKAKDIKIILCTGELNNSRLSSFVSEFKIDDVLLKPVSYKSLMNSLRNSLLKSSHE
eukprot:gene65-4314_t